ncbi:TadE/TadG family type IV pilus assembly protein [Comamonas sediminis]|uniref:TadE/TadG family type IV pilus assembly protein n=1 Tax=Comamonas sediminis TaxID=1783360 RepID=A0ABV4B1Q5_9BURK|nr:MULTISPECIES: TadE/TadG family type IV pilus assembly protein [unclassified Comamonas]ULR90552.1 pilus assembly protein [Comamonas sp. B21-038]
MKQLRLYLHTSAQPRRQRGVAAIEFALIAVFMVVMLLGVTVYWRAFQAQQSLTRAAGDGARAILGVLAAGVSDPCHPTQAAANRATIQLRVAQSVRSSLERSDIPGTVADQLTVGAIQWQAACPSTGTGSATFELRYQLAPLFGTQSAWVTEPRQLYEKSVVHFASLL